jgi:hypothetical protein
MEVAVADYVMRHALGARSSEHCVSLRTTLILGAYHAGEICETRPL